MICERCNIEHDGSYGSGRFCSLKCANSRGIRTKEFKAKVRLTRMGISTKFVTLICKNCKDEFNVKSSKRNKQKFCSGSCHISYRNKNNKLSAKHRENISTTRKNGIKSGRIKQTGGYTKWIKYKNIKVQGSYELNTCLILDDWKENKKIKDWEYTNDKFTYIGLDNKNHSYLIDFKIFENDGTFYYLEVKGRVQEKDYLKWQAVRDKGHKLEIWFKRDIENHGAVTQWSYMHRVLV